MTNTPAPDAKVLIRDALRVVGLSEHRPDEPEDLIVVFKTHEIEASNALDLTESYRVQEQNYGLAARLRGEATMMLHLTMTNVSVDLGSPVLQGT